MRRKLMNCFIFIIIAVMCVNMSGCIFNKKSEKASADQQPLVINLEGGDWGYPTPYGHYQRGPGIFKMQLLFDSLLQRGEEGLIPWLAEQWEVSSDGKEYTFTLREDVKWHDGQNLTAEDVKFSFSYFAVHPPVFDKLQEGKGNLVAAIEVVDEHTVKIVVETANATVLERLGAMRIIPEHIWAKVDDPKKFNTPEAVIGCGPYVLKAYDREQGAYRFEAFSDYWGPQPRVDVIQFVPVSDGILAFDQGEIDLTSVSPDLLAKYEDKKEFALKRNPAFWGYRLIFNMEKRPEFKEESLRQAIAYAVDQDELVEKVARGAARPASAGYLPVDHIWFNHEAKQYGYYPERAKELLEGKEYAFTLLTGNNNAELRIAELLKISLGTVGLKVQVKSVDMKTRDAAVKNKEYEMVLYGHGGWGNDADLLRSLYAREEGVGCSPSADGIPGYTNARINELCQRQLREMNPERRKELVMELQAVIAEEIPQLPLYNTTGYIVYRPEKYDGWRYMFDHHEVTHNKLSYLEFK